MYLHRMNHYLLKDFIARCTSPDAPFQLACIIMKKITYIFVIFFATSQILNAPDLNIHDKKDNYGLNLNIKSFIYLIICTLSALLPRLESLHRSLSHNMVSLSSLCCIRQLVATNGEN